MASLFGLGLSVAATTAAGAVNGLVQRGESKLVGAIGNKLGPVLGNSFSGANPRSWLAQAQARPDPHLNIDWSIVLPNDTGNIAAYVEEVTCPVWKWSGAESVFRGNQFLYYPEKIDTGSLSLVMYEDQKFTASAYVQSWMRRVGNPSTGLFNYPAAFKFPITVVALDAAQNPIATFYYYGCWPEDMGELPFQSAQTERTKITVKINVDGMALSVGNNQSTPSNFGFGNIADFIKGVPQSLTTSVANGAGLALNSALGSLF